MLEDPALYQLVKDGDALEVDLGAGTVRHLPTDRVFRPVPRSAIAQAFLRGGGLVSAVREHGPLVLEHLLSA